MNRMLNASPAVATSPDTPAGKPLITWIGLASGDILNYLEQQGPTMLRQLMHELEWTTPIIMMAVGALIRDGLVHAAQDRLGIRLESIQ